MFAKHSLVVPKRSPTSLKLKFFTTSKIASSLATHRPGAAATSVENATTSPERGHGSDERSPAAPIAHAENTAEKVKERDVRDALARRLHGKIEWLTPSGSIDVLLQPRSSR